MHKINIGGPSSVACDSSCGWNKFDISKDEIVPSCYPWTVTKLALICSVLRDDLDSDSDVDVLLSSMPDVVQMLSDFVEMVDELVNILGRKVDLVTRWAIERSGNFIRHNNILE